MISTCRILLVAGARPNFMKIAPIVRALGARKAHALKMGIDLQYSIVHTGQHYDTNMSDIFFSELEILRPRWHLGVGPGSHGEQTGKVMTGFEKVLSEERPDMVIVVGDVNSTLACSITAKKQGVAVAHVEAGLRSFDMEMPEEVNRKVTDSITDLFFVTEDAGVRNLQDEGVPEDRIYLVGNVMVDSLFHTLSRMEQKEVLPSGEVKGFCEMGRYAVLTIHRPSNVDSRETFLSIWEAIIEVARQLPILFPVHPRTKRKIEEFGLKETGITMIDPMGYLDMLYALKGATMVLTDSGGLQEETTALGIPCITIRKNTERPVTVETGTNRLVGTRTESILDAVSEILSGKNKAGSLPPLWDGRASERIVDVLLRRISIDASW
ncbi:MAG: UDP-N-acetylglucosamine 2-epimerase (non-hydrolyzing) [Deltaproteobacteria bacterium]|nr:UDP-N-acetylglucosamine 2-epimerase (non-hydrolyzing) [Deltaproteobacteria bacterium]